MTGWRSNAREIRSAAFACWDLKAGIPQLRVFSWERKVFQPSDWRQRRDAAMPLTQPMSASQRSQPSIFSGLVPGHQRGPCSEIMCGAEVDCDLAGCFQSYLHAVSSVGCRHPGAAPNPYPGSYEPQVFVRQVFFTG